MTAQAYDLTIQDFNANEETWCPGCGDFGVNGAIKRAMINLGLRPHEIVLITGIGCSSKISDYFKSYTYHTVHGRPLPVASAVKIANPDLNVIVATGDGDGYAIGMGHFIHAIRRNVNITMIVMNNQVYGLTKGQFSPTAARGYKSASSPDGSEEDPIDGAALALAAGASFVARTFSADMKGSIATFEAAIRYPGFSVVDDLSPCVTFNKVNTYAWYRQNIRKLEEEEYEPVDRTRALELVLNSGKIPVGILYRDDNPPDSYEVRVLKDLKRAPVWENLDPKGWDYERLMDEFR